jgi:predicted metal-dependent HD superfamily phosphohydrolase
LIGGLLPIHCHFLPVQHLLKTLPELAETTMTVINDKIKLELSQLYSAPDRIYHGLGHVETLLKLLDRYRAEFSDPEAVEAAVWFHDCIYDTRAKDNELKSAELAVTRLTDSVEEMRLSRIHDMIEATATHTVPRFSDPKATIDAAMFLDMDLSILGADEPQFDAYEAAVRKEYDWVDDEAWRKGRAEVLTRFMARPYIFYSEVFRDKYEVAARRNMGRSLASLGG